jgi:hypothetical protein
LGQHPGSDGKNADFKVAYTFGIAPQQYLIEVGEGRLQALGVAWDTESTAGFTSIPAGREFQESAALEQTQPERQLHVRRMPHHWLQAQFRCGQQHVQQPVEQPRGRLSGLPRPGLESLEWTQKKTT